MNQRCRLLLQAPKKILKTTVPPLAVNLALSGLISISSSNSSPCNTNNYHYNNLNFNRRKKMVTWSRRILGMIVAVEGRLAVPSSVLIKLHEIGRL